MSEEYTVGSIADLVSGSNTPNKPKIKKKEFTPKKPESNNGDALETPVQASVNASFTQQNSNKKKTPKKRKHSLDASQSVDETSPQKKRKSGKFSANTSDTQDQEAKGKKRLSDISNKQDENSPSKKRKSGEEFSSQGEEQTVNGGEEDGGSEPKSPKFKHNAERRIKNKGKSPKKNPSSDEAPELDPERESRTIYVGNVPLTTKKIKLQKFFMKYGKVEAIRFRGTPVEDPKTPKKVAAITKKYHKDRSTYFAFVRFENKESAEKALEANGSVFQDHHLLVTPSHIKEKPDESKAIFIGNISFDGEEEDIWKLFETCGPIESVRLVRDRLTTMGKGFGYVNFKTSDAAALALEMGEVKYKDRVLRISPCNNNAAKKNKKTNKPRRIDKPGRPKAQKEDSSDQPTEESSKIAPTIPAGSFQGSKVADKKKKKKFDKGMLEKKKMIKKLAPKPKTFKE